MKESKQAVDFFKQHDTKLNSELSRFYALTSVEKDKAAIPQMMQLRDNVMDHSEDYKHAVEDFKEFITGAVGYEPHPIGKDIAEEDIESATTSRLISSMDALIYRDLLENKGGEYPSLMMKRDAFTTAKENFIESLDKLVDASNNLEAKHQRESNVVFRNLRSAIEESKAQEKATELER